MALPLLLSFLGGGLAKAGVLGAAGSFLANPLVSSAIGSGIGSLIETKDPKQALMSGIGSFAGGKLLGGMMGGAGGAAGNAAGTSTNSVSGPMAESLRPMARPAMGAGGAGNILQSGMDFAQSGAGIGSAMGGMMGASYGAPVAKPAAQAGAPDISRFQPMEREARFPGQGAQPQFTGEFDYNVSRPYSTNYMDEYAPRRMAGGGMVESAMQNPYSQQYASERADMMAPPMGMAQGGGVEADYGFSMPTSAPIQSAAPMQNSASVGKGRWITTGQEGAGHWENDPRHNVNPAGANGNRGRLIAGSEGDRMALPFQDKLALFARDQPDFFSTLAGSSAMGASPAPTPAAASFMGGAQPPAPVASPTPDFSTSLAQAQPRSFQTTSDVVRESFADRYAPRGYAAGGMVTQKIDPTYGPIRLQEGGIANINAMAEEGGDRPPNEREIISGAVAAVKGQHPQPEIAMGIFLQTFGEDALRDLVDRVQSGELDEGMRDEDGQLSGPGDGMNDMIPASVDGGQDVLLSDGEYVVPADVVSGLGNGSSDAGSKALDEMGDRVRTERTGKKKQAPAVPEEKVMPV